MTVPPQSQQPAKPTTRTLRPEISRRQALIALNESPIPHDSTCRLAAAVDDWLGAASGEDAHWSRILSIPFETLQLAREVVDHAGAVAEQAESAAATLQARIVTRLDVDYPARLLDLELPPPVLYLRGELPRSPALAMVGPRNADPYALEVASLLARDLAAAGLVIVSGFARGVDITAHRAVLEVPGGRTVAVLGCGLAARYPRQHYREAERIAELGCVVSELPCHFEPRPQNFPIRNRIIAALADATLVVQASARSGSLITARSALELGREVLAVPGRIFDRRCRGSNALLRDGAHPALDWRSVLEIFPCALQDQLELARATAALELSGDAVTRSALAARLLELLDGRDHSTQELARAVGQPVGAILAALLELEIDERVRRLDGGRFAIRRL